MSFKSCPRRTTGPPLAPRPRDGRLGLARHRAFAVVPAMIGGVAVARAVHKARPGLSDDVLTTVRQVLTVPDAMRETPPARRSPARRASTARRADHP